MGEVHYMISEAAKRVGVEAHVLRYWEEELDLPIGRTEMGHRYYTEDDIRLFHCIKDLKEQSMQLRELKTVIPELKKAREQKKKKLAEMEERENSRMSQTEGQLVKAQPEVWIRTSFCKFRALSGRHFRKLSWRIIRSLRRKSVIQLQRMYLARWNVVSSERAERRRTLPQAGQPDQTAAADQTRECEDITSWKVEKIAGRIA